MSRLLVLPLALAIAMLTFFGARVHGFRQAAYLKKRLTSVSMSTAVSGGTREYLKTQVSKALEDTFGDAVKDADPLIQQARADFGDYQSNAAMPLAKKLKMKPQEIAEKLKTSINTEGVISSMDITGPGFINIKLSEDYIKLKMKQILQDQTRLGIIPVGNAKRTVVDFSSPNIAKEMHVGHLRSTIIGDSLSRILEFLGHDVVRLNHVGDWGTQFGMLIGYLKDLEAQSGDASLESGVSVGDLMEFYRSAKKRFDNEPDFKENARNEVVKLQSGEASSLEAWNKICDLSRLEFQKIYDLLDIHVTERGESFYNPYLAQIVEELKAKEMLKEDSGSQCVFLGEKYKGQDGQPLPLIVQKSDGGFLYATTDLAAIMHRVREEKADRILYVTDVGQSQHFQMVFDAAKMSGLAPTGIELSHVPFGLVLGEDGKKIKTRSGESVKLKDLLDEAVKIAEADISERSKENGGDGVLSDEQKRVASVVGLAAVKYADLSMNRQSDYRFSFKKMLSLQGNTAPYMLYAYARIQGIFRKAAESLYSDVPDADAEVRKLAASEFEFVKQEEIVLAKQLMRLEEVLLDVSDDLFPNKLCEYMFELSQKFNKFYEECPVLKAESASLQKSRAALCLMTADTLKKSLGLLGIDTVEKL